ARDGGSPALPAGVPDLWSPGPGFATPATPTEVAVLGMIHGRHRTSERWGLEQVRETVRRLRPDVVCAEIPPDRWQAIWRDFAERGEIRDPRLLRFPEYVDALLELSVQEGFRIVPCAAWTQEMSDLRARRIRAFDEDPAYAEARARYAAELAAVRARLGGAYGDRDDPRYIHSDAYDEGARAELSLYDRYQNDLIGPGGWTNINDAHFRLIDRTLRLNRGLRVLITFGAGHKYMFLDRLRGRPDLVLLDVRDFLP
ncbi:MAG: hypothetical protein D6701_11725, partial [Gemmatimonadetes bacterium]